jgi:isopentenyl-diphosphate delta-isomerase
MEEQVVLVDENDGEVGVGDKIKTHLDGSLHRAFSIFIFNADGELLLQQRAHTKYHSGGLWSNTCCSHPRPAESTEEAAHRRLREEMGFDCELEEIFSFIYRVKLDDGFFEHEYDHVFVGRFEGLPAPNAEEVSDWRWVQAGELKRDLEKVPEKYTFWLAASLDRILETHFA